MTTPIHKLLDDVKWELQEPPADNPDKLPYVTHSGIFEFLGHKLHVYQLDSGQRIIDADDMERFFTVMNDNLTDASPNP